MNICQPWVVVRNASSVVKREEDFISLRISNLPECFSNRGNSEEEMQKEIYGVGERFSHPDNTFPHLAGWFMQANVE